MRVPAPTAAASTTTATVATSLAVAGFPSWSWTIPAIAGLIIELGLRVHQAVRASRHEEHAHTARNDEARQLRILEQQAARMARTHPDPAEGAELLMRLVELRHAQSNREQDQR